MNCKDCKHFMDKGNALGHDFGDCTNPGILISDSLGVNPVVAPTFGCIQFEARTEKFWFTKQVEIDPLASQKVVSIAPSKNGPVPSPFGSRKP